MKCKDLHRKNNGSGVKCKDLHRKINGSGSGAGRGLANKELKVDLNMGEENVRICIGKAMVLG